MTCHESGKVLSCLVTKDGLLRNQKAFFSPKNTSMKKPSIHPAPWVVFIVLLLFFSTCSKEDELLKTPEPVPETTSKQNPFTPENIAKALENLMARTNGRMKMVVPSSTHNYVRFAPQNLEQVAILQDLGYDLWDEPLDQEIEYEGDYYQDPTVPDSLNYFYTLIPANYSITNQVPYTVVSQVVLFDDDAGDETDPEEIEDPWTPEPDPGSGYCYDEVGAAYICNSSPRVYLRQKTGKPEDLVRKTTLQLLEMGINLQDLYDEAMIVAGYDDEVGRAENGRSQGTRYYPQGRIMVQDNSTGADVPLRNVKVKAKRWFKIKSAWTNANGQFYVNKGFRKKAKIILKFKNSVVVRGINGALKAWQYVLPLRKKLGTFERSAMTNINHTIQATTSTESMGALQFVAAHCLNTFEQMKEMSTANNLPLPPINMNIWVSSAITQSASAPMLKGIMNTSQLVQALKYLLPGKGTAIITLLQRYTPDVTMRIQNEFGGLRNAADISGTFFHEFAHGQHWQKLGTISGQC